MSDKKVIKVGTIKGIDILTHREGKANKGNPEVSRGTGVHVPKKYKKKTKQNEKKKLGGMYR